ncbi:MAG: isoprenoid biosynthesis glyoxalase ElbB [Bacteroidales bacterium]|nr:isoprenoid biosynthesis glyoxalase ElbB [Bacteroidales bacterium]
MKNIAVILAGCGTKDGSEINETVTLLLALDQHGLKYQCFAPDANQYHVVNHVTGEVVNEERNMLVEAARIVRGEILPMTEFNADNFDGLAIPGGVGAANNLFTYFIDGMQMTVLPEVRDAIVKIHEQNKPIAAMCIAPVLLANVLNDITITLGNEECGPAKDILKMGAHHEATKNGEVTSDLKNKIFTTPCFMLESTLKDIYEDAYNLVDAFAKAL